MCALSFDFVFRSCHQKEWGTVRIVLRLCNARNMQLQAVVLSARIQGRSLRLLLRTILIVSCSGVSGYFFGFILVKPALLPLLRLSALLVEQAVSFMNGTLVLRTELAPL